VAKSKFKLPADNELPIILVGTGSGISPYFGFLEQRSYNAQTLGKKLGKAVLIHGCRSTADFALKEKVEADLAGGVITTLWPAYSKEEGNCVHIQDVIEREGATLWDLVNNQEAVVYVCGDIQVGVSVREALIKIGKQHGNLGAFSANMWLERLQKAGRLRHDEWGISTHSAASVIRAARLKLWRRSIMTVVAFISRARKSGKKSQV